MKHLNWIGWLLASLLLTQNAAVGLAMKFRLEVAEMGDQVIEAIPTASLSQWNALFGSALTVKQLPPPVNPEPFPGHS